MPTPQKCLEFHPGSIDERPRRTPPAPVECLQRSRGSEAGRRDYPGLRFDQKLGWRSRQTISLKSPLHAVTSLFLVLDYSLPLNATLGVALVEGSIRGSGFSFSRDLPSLRRRQKWAGTLSGPNQMQG